MNPTLRRQLETLLATVDPRGTKGRRLLDDCDRLCARVRHLLSLDLIPPESDADALELACAALQLVPQHPRPSKSPMTLRDRADAAAELLVTGVKAVDDPTLLDRTTRLLRELPQRSPAIPEARLLADAVNLEDFGVTGILHLTIALAQQGSGIRQVTDACERREAYGYWDARLKDGFQFEPVRQMARRRLEHARQMSNALREELGQDGPS